MYIPAHQLMYLRRLQRLLDQLSIDGPAEALTIPASRQPRENIIVFTGSFNPPTNAHLALLMQAQMYSNTHDAMYIYAAFSKRTIDKESVERPLLVDRIALLQEILQKRLPRAGILLFNRGLYAEQAEAVRNSFPHVRRILFLMGYDKIVQIFDPRYYRDRDAALTELFRLAEVLAVPRGSGGKEELAELIHRPENEPFARFIHIQPFNAAYRNISSTTVRQDWRGYEHDVPQEVRRFMRRTLAYASPMKYADGTEVDYYQQRIALITGQS